MYWTLRSPSPKNTYRRSMYTLQAEGSVRTGATFDITSDDKPFLRSVRIILPLDAESLPADENVEWMAPYRRAADGQMQRVGVFYGFQPGYGIVVDAERGRTTFFTTRFQPAPVVQDWVNNEDTRRAYGPCAHQEIGKKLSVSVYSERDGWL
ncbi:MAG TPA: hypothetical protein PKZ76_03050 [Xanthomonadaceae bacterium]|nr:hypothetical protein [Xanthomonadaceae bacterium]